MHPIYPEKCWESPGLNPSPSVNFRRSCIGRPAAQISQPNAGLASSGNVSYPKNTLGRKTLHFLLKSMAATRLGGAHVIWPVAAYFHPVLTGRPRLIVESSTADAADEDGHCQEWASKPVIALRWTFRRACLREWPLPIPARVAP